MPDLTITLSAAAVAAILNIWLAIRCGQARIKGKVAIGDGGDVALTKRMRAHANYVENVPFALILILLLELSGKGGLVLAVSAALYFVIRICHMFGMEADIPGKLRTIGAAGNLLFLLGWAVTAVLVVNGVI